MAAIGVPYGWECRHVKPVAHRPTRVYPPQLRLRVDFDQASVRPMIHDYGTVGFRRKGGRHRVVRKPASDVTESIDNALFGWIAVDPMRDIFTDGLGEP